MLEPMTCAYMEWSASRGADGLGSLDVDPAGGELEEERVVQVVDIFCKYVFCLPLTC